MFSSGASLESIDAVCGGDDVLGALTSLVEKSLVDQRAGAGGEPRFTMLETIREYALHQLAAADELAQVRSAHAMHFADLAEAAEPQVLGGSAAGREIPTWLDRLEEEQQNLRAALAWAVETASAEVGLRLVAVLQGFWMWRGSRTEARGWADRLLGLPGNGVTPCTRIRALTTAATHAWMQADRVAALARGEEAVALARQAGDDFALPLAMRSLYWVARDSGDLEEADRLIQESLSIARRNGNGPRVAFDLYWLGLVAQDRGDLQAARDAFVESLGLFRAADDDWGQAIVHSGLAGQRHVEGDAGAAEATLREALRCYERLGDLGGTADMRCGLGVFAARRGDYAAGRALLAQSLRAHRDQVARGLLVYDLGGAALVAAGMGAEGLVLRIAATVAALAHRPGQPRTRAHGAALDNDLEPLVEHARAALGPAPAAVAWRAGEEMTADEAVAEAIAFLEGPTVHSEHNR